jgi:hypothetical protein
MLVYPNLLPLCTLVSLLENFTCPQQNRITKATINKPSHFSTHSKHIKQEGGNSELQVSFANLACSNNTCCKYMFTRYRHVGMRMTALALHDEIKCHNTLSMLDVSGQLLPNVNIHT